MKDHFSDLQNIAVQKSGYIYIYVSNESPVNVFFDNLQVVHTRGAILEETHYYPFGLTMAGITSKALAFGGAENKYKFNCGTELSSKEFSDGSGLELYETAFRGYDPQIGRFWQIDPMADEYEDLAPYTFGLNNPILFNDPSGLEPDPPRETSTPDNPKILEDVLLKSTPKNNWKYTDWTLFADVNKRLDVIDLTHYLKNQGVNDRGMVLFNKAWDNIGYRERLAEINQAWANFVMKALLEGATWVAGGVLLKIGGKLIKVSYEAYKVWRVNKVRQGTQTALKIVEEIGIKEGTEVATKEVVNQTSQAILKNGYYEVNGFKFSEYYYNKLWTTGRGAPSLVAKQVLEGGAKTAVPDAIKAGFNRYVSGGWEMVFNPMTKEVWHLQPIR